MTVSPLEINYTTYKQFSKSLYSSEYPINDAAHARVLNNLEFPHVSEDTKGSLDTRLTAAVILQAVDSVKAGKSTGPDKLPVDIYKKFKHKIQALHFLCFLSFHKILPFQESILREALITLIPKPRKPIRRCQGFCPVIFDILIFFFINLSWLKGISLWTTTMTQSMHSDHCAK